jgi:hypothetical protein
MLELAVILIAAELVLLLILRPVIWWYLGLSRAIRALESIASSLECLPCVRVRDERNRRAG